MKITQSDYQTLASAIYRSAQGAETLSEYVDQHGLTAKRWRWMLLWRAKRVGILRDGFIESLYTYCNDEHIDTALRRITGTRKVGSE
jgi:hypothetical protein